MTRKAFILLLLAGAMAPLAGCGTKGPLEPAEAGGESRDRERPRPSGSSGY